MIRSAIRLPLAGVLAGLALAATFFFPAAAAAAAEVGFQFAIPNRAFPDDAVVDGMRVSLLWGKNARTSGFDLGLFSVSETTTRTGFALVGGVSRVSGNVEGAVSLSFMNYHSGRDSGFNCAFINRVNDTQNAFNLGLLQLAEGRTSIDVGALNVSKRSEFQFGFVNVTDQIDGLQLGFINLAENGFFKFFPFFNYAKKGD